MNGKLKVLDLFSGIGGFSLGLERTGGFETVAFCEIEPYPRAVLAKHWPRTPIYQDVRTLRKALFPWRTDIICGGFPCQDISLAGKGAGLTGERSGLWSEFHRLIKEIKPKYAIIENVSALRSRGLDQVLRGLAEIGYDAEWHRISAGAVGAPHERERLWIIAYPYAEYGQARLGVLQNWQSEIKQARVRNRNGIWIQAAMPPPGVEYGVSHWVDRRERTECLGNSIVPQIAEIIGAAILRAECIVEL
jgi:DNA (cytosine-5)-methyltransferase 1